MKCFYFYMGDRKGDLKTTKSASVTSMYSNFTDREMGRSGSELNSQNVSATSVESVGRPSYPSLSQRPSNLRSFTVSELKAATRNFSRSVMVGEGGFGCVYRGSIKSIEEPTKKIEVAVKQLGKRGTQASLFYSLGTVSYSHLVVLQGHKQWVTEVNVLGVVEHPNLVKLVGYCADDDERGIQRLLIYEFMPNGSVEDHLSSRAETPLPWNMRLRVAQDAARGLTYLHEEMDFQIIFRDFKSSNILLDEQWNAKLSDFGLARLGPDEGFTHVSTAVVGTMGYAAPEYVQTGRLTSKSDVWSYGVFLYELLTGRRPMDRNRPKNEQKLLDWVKPFLSEKRFPQILDPRLHGKYRLRSAQKLANIANKCLVRNPKARPKMSDVLEMVNRVVDSSTESSSPEESFKSSASMAKKRNEESSKALDDSWFMRVCTPRLVRSC
ncbi:Serine/threonine-protein kinase PCRK1 [Linum perenne]